MKFSDGGAQIEGGEMKSFGADGALMNEISYGGGPDGIAYSRAGGAAPPGSPPSGLEWLSDLTRVIPLKKALEGPEKLLIERALARHDGRRDRAAQELGITRSTLFNKMRKYDLLDVNFSAGRA